MKPIISLADLFINEIKALYAIETEELNEISYFLSKINNDELKLILTMRMEQTKKQIIRLEEASSILEVNNTFMESKLLKENFEEAKTVIQNITELSVKEARIILCFQTIAHIEIASYGTLLSFAKIMEINDLVSLLDKSLEEEKIFDLKLTILAEYKINKNAKIETYISLS